MTGEIYTSNDLSITPLGAGDLVDRAVRFYRAYFRTFIFIAAVPVVIGTLVSVGWHFAARQMFTVGSRIDPGAQVFYYLFIWLGTLVIWFTETVATLVVMGGASRNFVRHLLFGEEISFGSTYRNTWSRLGGLIVASSIISIILGVVGIIVFYIGMIAAGIGIMLVAWALSAVPVLAFLVSLVVGLVATGAAVWLFFLLASRFAYVPQVMLVEGRNVVSAIGRSASLASGNVKRLVALFFFTLFATYSALALFYVPLAWYAWVNGIDFFGDPNNVPATFEVMTQLVSQASLILLSPVWMIGLCLLYVDERVRHEGYDIELAAARRLGDIPDVPADYINPLQPALGAGGYVHPTGRAKDDSRLTSLGLN